MTPADELTAAADRLDAIPNDELERCLGVDGQPCGAEPALSRDTVRALAEMLRWHGDNVPSYALASGMVEVARAILDPSKETR